MKKEDLIKALAKGKGNPVYIVGSATGKDGIHGATFASADVTENSADDIPSIQVGDPFQEKLLLEATLELGKSGAIVGSIQLVSTDVEFLIIEEGAQVGKITCEGIEYTYEELRSAMGL